MSNARDLALLEKWTSSSNGATILPALSSPTSPKATKFCCCPNRRRYQLKQPKLTTTLHVRNIFVDNDFNFIDDTTNDENEDDDDEANENNAVNDEEFGYDEELLTYDNRNYKRAESWPSARRSQKTSRNNIHNYNNNNSKLTTTPKLDKASEVHKENRRNEKAVATQPATSNDYDDVVVEIATNETRLKNASSVAESAEKVKVGEAEKQWRHDKSCHNNRNNCLTKKKNIDDNYEDKNDIGNVDADDDDDNNSRCSIESFNSKAHQEQQTLTRLPLLSPQGNQTPATLSPCIRKPPIKPSVGNDAGEVESASICGKQQKHQQQQDQHSEHFQKGTLSNLNSLSSSRQITANEQITPATSTNINRKQTSPLIQRLSELREFKPSLCKEEFSNITTTTTAATPTPTTPQHNCNNCQFCFNQSCRNFSQLQQSLQDHNNSGNNSNNTKNTKNNNNTTNQVRSQQQSSTFSDNQKMTITTATTNVANNFKRNAVANSANDINNGSGNSGNICGLATTSLSSPLTTTTSAPRTRTQTPPSSLKLNSTTAAAATTTTATSTGHNGGGPISPITAVTRSNNPLNLNQTPSSPLTTTVIKTTMVKRSPASTANESTTLTPSSPATSVLASPTSASLTLEKSLAFITTASPTTTSVANSSNNVHDFLAAKENKPANSNSNKNKCMTDTTAAPSSSTPLSVKERIAALVAGNGKWYFFGTVS